MDSLVKALLLDKSEEMSIHATRYTVTPAGARFAPRFCYGHREVTSIDSFTPIAITDGFKETTVTYSYTMKEGPSGPSATTSGLLPRNGSRHHQSGHRQSHPRPDARRLADSPTNSRSTPNNGSALQQK